MAIRELTLASLVVRMVLAVSIGGVLGLERGRKNRPAGLRTYMLVCLGAAVVMITNQYVVQVFGIGDPVRMGAQVISGIGFLGAGSIIITGRNQIRGLTTAAGLWAAACVGLAVGIGFYEVALIAGACIFLILTCLHNLDFFVRKRARVMDVFIELDSKGVLSAFVHYMRDANIEISNLQMENDDLALPNTFSFVVTIKTEKYMAHDELLIMLKQIPHLVFIEEL